MFRKALLVTLGALSSYAVGVSISAQLTSSLQWEDGVIKDRPNHDDIVSGQVPLADVAMMGERLFSAKFNSVDGAGRPLATGDSKPTYRIADHGKSFLRTSGPDSNSCAGCHNEPFIGGSGEFAVNVFVGAQFADPPTTSIDFRDTNERNTISIAGAAAMEMLAREMTTDLLAIRQEATAEAIRIGRRITVPLQTKDVSFGTLTVLPDGTYDASLIEGIDEDLILKPFGFKGVVISLREFAINALNHHFGIQAIERFGWERTGVRDFDGDGIENEFSTGQVTALTVFQAVLPIPSRQETTQRTNGEELFRTIGCADCHKPSLPLEATEFSEPNPFNRPGNLSTEETRSIRIPIVAGPRGAGVERTAGGALTIHAYTDLKRHRICDAEDPFFCNEKKRQDRVPTDQFLTPKLWDLATSAPYGHRGDCGTLSEVILHHSAEGKRSKEKFKLLTDQDKRALIQFLLSLGQTTYQSPFLNRRTQ